MDRELKETIAFMYKYYNLQPKIDQLQEMVDTRVKELIVEGQAIIERIQKQLEKIPPLVNEMMKDYSEKAGEQVKEMQGQVKEILAIVEKMLPKISSEMMNVYLTRVQNFILDALNRVKVFAKNGAEFTTDTVLRGVHAGLKRTAEMEKTMRMTAGKLRESVTVNIGEKGINVDISHLDITPSFKALMNQSKVALSKALKDSMEQAEFLVRQTQTDVAMLRMTKDAPTICSDHVR